MKKIKIYLLFVLVLTSCVQQSSPQTSVPLITENAITVTPQPIAVPTATSIPLTETRLSKDTFLFPCDSNLSTVIPLKKDTALNILGSYGEMAVVTSYADKSEVCGLVALTSLENKPANSVPSEYFVTSEPVNAISLFKDLQDDRLKVESDDKLVIDNTVASDTKEGYYLTFNNDQPVSTLNPFAVSLRFEAKDISSIMIFGKPRDWNKDWWQDVTFLEIACNKNQCDVSFYDGTSENGQSLTSFENNPNIPLQILFQDPLGNELDFIFPDGKSENFKLHAPLFPDKQMEVGAQAGPNSRLEVNEYKILQVPYSHVPQVITPENATNIQLLATWGKGIPTNSQLSVRSPVQILYSENMVLVQAVLGAFLYDLNTGEQIYSTLGTSVSRISNDGKLLAAGYEDSYVRIWDIKSNSLVAEYSVGDYKADPQSWDIHKACKDRASSPSPTTLEFSKDGSLIAAGYCDGTVGIWNIRDKNQPPKIWPGFLGYGDLEFSKNGQYLYIGRGWMVKLKADGVEGVELRNHGSFQDFDVSPDGKDISFIYCVENECKVEIAPLAKSSRKSFVLGKGEIFPEIKYTEDGTSLIVDLPTHGERLTLDANSGQINETTNIPVLTNFLDLKWLIEKGHVYYSTVGFGKNPVGFTAGLQGENMLSDGLAWGVSDKRIFWWNVLDNTVKIYSRNDGKVDFSVHHVDLKGFIYEQPQDVFFSPDGLQAAWCKDAQVTVISYEELELPKVFSPLPCNGSIAISPDHNSFAVWSRNKISLVSISSGEIRVLSAHSRPIIGVSFSKDGTQMVSTAKNEIFLWELSSIKSTEINNADLLAAQYVPNPQFIHGFGDVWCDGWCTDQSTFNLMKAISPSGNLMANTYGGGGILLWKLPFEENYFEFKAHEPVFASTEVSIPLDITSLSFLPDGTGLISVGSDGVIKLWGVR